MTDAEALELHRWPSGRPSNVIDLIPALISRAAIEAAYAITAHTEGADPHKSASRGTRSGGHPATILNRKNSGFRESPGGRGSKSAAMPEYGPVAIQKSRISVGSEVTDGR